jgi:hypothetical protein
MTSDLQDYSGQCTLSSLAPRLLGQCSLGIPGPPPRYGPISALARPLLPTRPSPETLPLSSLFISHVAYAPSIPVLTQLSVSTGGSVCSHLLTLVPRLRIFTLKIEAIRSSETSVHTRSTDVPPKRRFTQDLHGVTSQKTAFFIVTAVKTSNLTI